MRWMKVPNKHCDSRSLSQSFYVHGSYLPGLLTWLGSLRLVVLGKRAGKGRIGTLSHKTRQFKHAIQLFQFGNVGHKNENWKCVSAV